MNFCKDCRYLKKKLLLPVTLAKCRHPESIDEQDFPIDGTIKMRYCSSMRAYGACGPEGKLYAPR